MQRPLLTSLCLLWIAAPALTAPPVTYRVTASTDAGSYAATGTIEAVRQGTLGAQLSGRVLEVLVRSGESVRAGQALIRIGADDVVAAASASVAAANGATARLATVRAEFERAQTLRAQDYISVAALQRSEAALRTAEADAQASGAAANAARTRAAWRIVTAPYAGVVTDIQVAAGDLATPGRPLVAIYAPGALRVLAQVPESLAGQLQATRPAMLAGMESGQLPVAASSWSVVSAVDPATHSVEVRAELPAAVKLRPGQFVRLLLPLKAVAAQLRIPLQAVLHRSEVNAVYVVDANGAAHLRQVRLGPNEGAQVTVLAGLQGGEQIALNPAAVAAGRN